MTDLFEDDAEPAATGTASPSGSAPDSPAAWMMRPLADRLRPVTFEEFLGQEKLVAEGAALRALIAGDRVPSMILWGPPGSGKTTLATLIARETRSEFITLSAVTAGIKDVRGVVERASLYWRNGKRTILFVDEIHRFSKAQQDAFLPHVESGLITLIGATTENPSFSVIAPLLSRCRVFTLQSLADANIGALVDRGLAELNAHVDGPALSLDDDARAGIIALADGDARRALGMLEVATNVLMVPGAAPPTTDARRLTRERLFDITQRHLAYDKQGEEFYNIISALHKTVRSSDPHGAVYWCERMLAAGEDPRTLLRRMARMASEDIGLADPRALRLALDAVETYERLGSPEGELALAQACLYLACAPKSNAAYVAYNAARAFVQAHPSSEVPIHLRNAPTRLMKELGYGRAYRYAHDEPEAYAAGERYFPDDLPEQRFYTPSPRGLEGKIAEKLAHLKKLDEEAGQG